MLLLKYIPLQLTCSLILGILFGYYLNPTPRLLFSALFVLLGLFILLFFLSNQNIGRSTIFMSSTLFVFFFIGIAAITYHNDLNRKNHYTTLLSEEHTNKAILEIRAVLKPNNYFLKYEANVLKINNQKTRGKVLVNLFNDSLNKHLKVDEKIFVNTTFLEINEPKNPYQFNYKDYLAKHNIYRQISISKEQLLALSSHNTSLVGLAHRFRLYVNDKLVMNGFKDDELAIINALLLGQRQEISKDLIDNYAKAGAIHILAVSGLHVGLIMFLISFFLKPLNRFNKIGKVLQTMILILLLWVFAFIAGMSASVVRAVTMFTALSIGLAIGRKNSVYKNLIISLFVLLLCNPYYLFKVGFQLSYIAVFSIVWMQPMLYKSWKPKWKLTDYFWQLFTVSLAAQIGVLPLSLYYFHQFPGLFFVTNLVIIPVLGIILGLGIFIIFLSLFNMTPIFLGELYQKIIGTMNTIISWIAQQESFSFQEISFSIILVLCSYIFIIFCFRWIDKKNGHTLKYVLFSLIILQSAFIYEKYKSISTEEFVVFNKNKASAIAIKKKGKIRIYKSENFGEQHSFFRSYKIGSNADGVETIDSVKNVFMANNKRIIVIDSMAIYKLNNLQPDGIILRQSPQVNLTRLIDEINPKFIIADASNYKSYIKQWQRTCLDRNIQFHYTVKEGAFFDKF